MVSTLMGFLVCAVLSVSLCVGVLWRRYGKITGIFGGATYASSIMAAFLLVQVWHTELFLGVKIAVLIFTTVGIIAVALVVGLIANEWSLPFKPGRVKCGGAIVR